MKGKVRVLFVCLGNICRSPAAEGAFRHLVEANQLSEFFEIDSAGTANYHEGELPHPTTRLVAQEFGILLTHRSRQFTYSDFLKFDYILAMDSSNYRDILRLAKTEADRKKVFMFRKFDSNTFGDLDVPDPYYSVKDGFIEVQEIVTNASEGLLNWIKKQQNIS